MFIVNVPDASTSVVPKLAALSHHKEMLLGGKYLPVTVRFCPFCTNKDVAKLVLLPNNPVAVAALIWLMPLRYSMYEVVELHSLVLSWARKTMLSYATGLSPVECSALNRERLGLG